MTTVSYKIHIDAPVEKVWNILADFGGIYKWNPGVSHSHSTSSNNEGFGASRHCDLKPSGSIEERILEWHEGESYTLEIYDGKGAPPFKQAVAKLAVKPEGSGAIATMTIEYSLKFGPVGALMNLVMVKPFTHKATRGVLAGLKHHAETGELVDSGRGLQFVAVPT